MVFLVVGAIDRSSLSLLRPLSCQALLCLFFFGSSCQLLCGQRVWCGQGLVSWAALGLQLWLLVSMFGACPWSFCCPWGA